MNVIDLTEEWRVVVGSCGRYIVSNLGKIRRVGRTCDNGRTIKDKTLFQNLDGGGYLKVSMRFVGGRVTRKVHRIVSDAFIGDKPPGMHTCHNDGNKLNNCSYNLRYDSPSGNEADKILHGTKRFGELMQNTELTECVVIAIKDDLTIHETDYVADKYGTTKSIIRDIIRNKTWTHIPNPVGFPTPTPRTELNDTIVKCIKKDLMNERVCDVAKKYGVHRATISDIKRGKTWKHVRSEYE